jgi:hypothetical protein
MMSKPGKEIPKEYREIVAYQIERLGWRYDPKGKGHPVLYPADKAHGAIRMAQTPSDRRGIKNFVAVVRRAGGIWPPEGRQR